MSKPAPPRDAVTVVIPVHHVADQVEKVVPAWAEALVRTGRVYEILVVDDGSTDATPAALERLTAGRVKHLRVLTHDSRRGFGACLRTALEATENPLFFYTSPDFPYYPSDLRRLLDRIEVRDEVFGKQPDLISGCRTGRPVPLFVEWFGRAWRLFWRVLFGLHMEALPAWQGTREFLYNRFVGWVFGQPLADVNSAFKLYRTEFLKRFPIQSDGDFVHTELVAKATFLTSIMDEIPLTAVTPPEVARPSVLREMWRVFKHPEFTMPQKPGESQKPGEPGNGSSPEKAMPTSGGLTPPGSPVSVSPPAPLTFSPVV